MHEFTAQITDLRNNLGFTVREVARSGNPVIVRRYDREEVILVPLAEWRRLQDLEREYFEDERLETERTTESFVKRKEAEAKRREKAQREFAAVINVARGRMSQIRPLASHEAVQDRDFEDTEGWLPPLPNSPEIEQKRVPLSSDQPQTPAGRMDRWQRKLLDLSLRNRLLNFRPSKQTVPVLCPDVSRLEDRLACGTRMRLVSLKNANPIGSRDAELHLRRTQSDLHHAELRSLKFQKQ